MTRLLLTLLLIAVFLAPTDASTTWDSPLFESPVWDGSDGVITAQLEAHTYLLPTIRVGHSDSI